MNTSIRKIAGFMSAESIYSLAFYIVMVAAIAGVGAGVMSKTATAKAVSAVSLIRANYQAETAVAGFNGAPVTAQLVQLSGGLLTPSATATDAFATLSGAGTFAIINRNPATATGITGPAFGLNISNITSPDVCKAVGSVGWGTWEGVNAAAITASSAPAALITTRSGAAANDLLTLCNAATPAAAVTLGFVSR